ncbi:MAG: spore protein alpha/beta [Peptococcaceae bacterium BRH_c23]|nr:MAG: spore protein alpha/beta [Peptococcaceae bacterium BRH_c23]KJS80064.1 MAG: spore protein alpha/beta [Desulfosporosinus sp. BICA1-9]HBW38612.1 small acid-soluble spore protein [Desulfosporosinus sp.]
MAKYNLPVNKDNIANEWGIKLGGDRTSRENGSVGGEMVKRTFESFGKAR